MTHQQADIVIADCGTIWTFRGATEAGRDFLANLATESWQWIGDRLGVDHRPARALFDHIVEEGTLTFDLV